MKPHEEPKTWKTASETGERQQREDAIARLLMEGLPKNLRTTPGMEARDAREWGMIGFLIDGGPESGRRYRVTIEEEILT